jgi:hypothetical protein
MGRMSFQTALKAILAAIFIWMCLGTLVAAFISSVIVSLLVVEVLPRMAVTAAMLGLAQGLCLLIASDPDTRISGFPTRNPGSARWLGAISGGVFGVLGFPPVYSHTNFSARAIAVEVFVVAAITGGAVAGARCSSLLAGILERPLRPGIVIALTLVFASILGAVDYEEFWDATADRLPVPEVTERAIAKLGAGNAAGNAWSGCYDFRGTMSLGSGMSGGESGLLAVKQSDGVLEISTLDHRRWHGGVDENGRFRVGVKTDHGSNELLDLWEGQFSGGIFSFTKRSTLLGNGRVINSTKLIGTAERVPCGH